MTLPNISTLSGLSTNGINVWGDQASIKAVMRAMYSDSILEDVRTQARQWREECGKVHSNRLALLALIKVLLDNDPNEAVADSGETVLDVWRHEASTLIAKAEGK